MKCKLLRPMQTRNPAYSEPARQRAIAKKQPYRVPRDIWIEKGAVVEDPEAWILVRAGVAEPMDKECIEAAGNLKDDEILRRAIAYEKTDRGIMTGRAKFDGSGEPGRRVPAGLDLGTAGLEIKREADNDEDEDDDSDD